MYKILFQHMTMFQCTTSAVIQFAFGYARSFLLCFREHDSLHIIKTSVRDSQILNPITKGLWELR